jgi:hypothetical protein
MIDNQIDRDERLMLESRVSAAANGTGSLSKIVMGCFLPSS